MPLIHRLSLFDHQDLLPGIFPDQFQRRKDSRRPCPDDNNVILHKNPSCPASYPAIISYLSGNGKQDCVFQTSAGFLQEYCPVYNPVYRSSSTSRDSPSPQNLIQVPASRSQASPWSVVCPSSRYSQEPSGRP